MTKKISFKKKWEFTSWDKKFEQLKQEFEKDSKKQEPTTHVMDRIFDQTMYEVRNKNTTRTARNMVGIAVSVAVILGVTNFYIQTVYGKS